MQGKSTRSFAKLSTFSAVEQRWVMSGNDGQERFLRPVQVMEQPCASVIALEACQTCATLGEIRVRILTITVAMGRMSCQSLEIGSTKTTPADKILASRDNIGEVGT